MLKGTPKSKDPDIDPLTPLRRQIRLAYKLRQRILIALTLMILVSDRKCCGVLCQL